MQIGQFVVLKDGSSAKIISRYYDTDICEFLLLLYILDTHDVFWIREKSIDYLI